MIYVLYACLAAILVAMGLVLVGLPFWCSR